MTEPKRAEPMKFVNCEAEPLVIRAQSGSVTWRRLRAHWVMDEDGGIGVSLTDNQNFDESEHSELHLHTGGFATMIHEDGKCIVYGTGLSAPGETK